MTPNPEPPWGDRTPTPREWVDWMDNLDPEKLPAGKLRDLVERHREAQEFRARWNPYGWFDLGIDLDDGPGTGAA